jgi:hypothetical protein
MMKPTVASGALVVGAVLGIHVDPWAMTALVNLRLRGCARIGG